MVVSNTALPSLDMSKGTVFIHWEHPTDNFSLRLTFSSSGVKSIFSSAPAHQVRVILILGPEDAGSLSPIILLHMSNTVKHLSV